MPRTSWIRSLSLIAVAVAIGCGAKPEPAAAKSDAAAPAAPVAAASAAGSATITGKALFAGAAPAPMKIKMDADPVCQQQHATAAYMQELVVNNGGLQNVFVYVKSGLEGKSFPTPTEPVVFDQSGCLYNPHVVGVQVNQPFQIVNSDATLHNVNAKPTQSTPFNLAMPTKGMKIAKSFAKPEIMVPIKCNVHPWMHAYVGVVGHPFFAVTGADGTFTIKGLQAGTYTLEAWHEKLGTATQTVTVADGQSSSVTFSFES